MPLMTATSNELGSTTLSASALAATVVATLPGILDAIVDKEYTDDGQGTSSETWATLATDVPCSLEKPTLATEKVIGGTEVSSQHMILRVPLGTDLQPPYSAVKSGQLYNVIDTDAGITGAIYLSAVVVRLWNWPVS